MTSLTSLTFEPGCKLSEIHGYSFTGCSALVSFCVPKFVEVMESGCFADLAQLRSVTFEPGSILREIKANAFDHSPAFKSLFSSRLSIQD
jgi:hypothetical protein